MPKVVEIKIQCEKCKHYEAYHKCINSYGVARHYCKKCNEAIQLRRENYDYNSWRVWFPKNCYFNNYFEEKESEV